MSTEFHQIQIYVRHISSSQSRALLSVSGPNQIDELVEHMRLCGVHCEGETHYTVAVQYVVDDFSCFVELIVGEVK